MMNDFFWLADKQQNFLQVVIIILGVHKQECPNYPKLEICVSLQISLEKRGR